MERNRGTPGRLPRNLLALLLLLGSCGRPPSPDDPPEGTDDGRTDVAQPALTAQLLAPGVISTDSADELQPSLSADGRTLYFVRRVGDGPFTLFRSDLDADGRWAAPQPLSISGTHGDQEPHVSRDGQRLYFTSDRPLTTGGDRNRGRQPWIAEWGDGGWSTPRPLDPTLTLDPPPDADVSRFWGQPRGPTEGPDGALYFWAERPDTRGHTDLYRAARTETGFGTPANLGPPVNSERYETGLAFAPDGAWVVFGRDEEAGGFGLGDLYVAQRTTAGWSEPRNVGAAVNSAGFDASPHVTDDGRHLLFSSNRARTGSEDGRHDLYIVPTADLVDEAARD